MLRDAAAFCTTSLCDAASKTPSAWKLRFPLQYHTGMPAATLGVQLVNTKMSCLMPLVWLLFIVILWVSVIEGIQDPRHDADTNRRTAAVNAIVVAAVPPTIVFLVSAFVLTLASPTVQFNVGSSFAMSLWTFWAENWPGIFGCSLVLTVGYSLWAVMTFVATNRRHLQHVVVCGAIASLWGTFVVSLAAPRV